jgi:hypothetical protein
MRSLAILLVAMNGCFSPVAPALPAMRDLSGTWIGSASFGSETHTPFRIRLTDADGTLQGAGIDVGCSVGLLCDRFTDYAVTGTHDRVTITLSGRPAEGEAWTWTMTGAIQPDGLLMTGTIAVDDTDAGTWTLSPPPIEELQGGG